MSNMFKKIFSKPLQTKKVLRPTKELKKETGIVKYKDLVTSQEIVREVGRLLDKFILLAPEMPTFCISTPRNSFTILCNHRIQQPISS